MAYKYIIMPKMKNVKGNNNSRTNKKGGSKDKGKTKRVVYSQANEPTASVGKDE